MAMTNPLFSGPGLSTHRKSKFPAIAALLLATALGAAPLDARPLRVFILAGQSNMEGPAHIRTFDYLADDPATAPLLQTMRGADGQPRVCDKVRISYLTGANDENFSIHGKLTAGYGSLWGLDRTKPGDKIGPEFTFGLTMEDALDGPVLLIKAAWGGKSLHTDFRPPSAGPYELSSFQLENYPKQDGHGIPKDFEQWKVDKKEATGRYYRLMMEHIKQVLGDIPGVHPEYDASQGFELSGFIWFQGFNDMVDSHVYPRHNQSARFAPYTDLLAHFIRDVRKDLNAPLLPFVIGVMGVGGLDDTSAEMTAFRHAMAAPTAMPEFAGNVAAVPTAPFWSDALGTIDQKRGQVRQMEYFLNSNHKDHANAEGNMSDEEKRAYLAQYEAELITPAERALWERGASNAGYHYLGSAKTFALIGRAFAETNLKLLKAPKP